MLSFQAILRWGSDFLWKKKKSQYKHDLTVVGFINNSDGIGRLPVELIGLLNGYVSMNFLSTIPSCYDGLPPDVKEIALQSFKDFGKVVVFQDALVHKSKEGYIPSYKILKSIRGDERIKLAYSMFESSKLPKEWVKALNKYFDAVIVPDEHLVEVYQSSGVVLPIFVIPIGLDLNSFLQQPLKKERNKPFIFANYSAGTFRKNHLTLIRAFAQVYKNNPEFLLIINGRYFEKNILIELKNEIEAEKITNVEVLEESVDKNKYLDRFCGVDCYVSVSKGEGFSIQPREAMALGIPSIVSNNTAQQTLAKSGLSIPVKSSGEVPAVYPSGETHGSFYQSDVNEISGALKDVVNNYDEYLKLSPKMRKWSEKYLHENLRPSYLSLVKPERVVLSECNKILPSAIETNSAKLFLKYKKLYPLLNSEKITPIK